MKPVTVALPVGWGSALVCAPGNHWPRTRDTCRAYDHTGHQLVWTPPLFTGRHHACDVEQLNRDCSFWENRFWFSSRHAFLRAWVRAEVLAKLARMPILLWLKQHGLDINVDVPGMRILVMEHTELQLVMAFGC